MSVIKGASQVVKTYRLLLLAFLFLQFIALCPIGRTGTNDNVQGAGFDPTPVQIPKVERTVKRKIRSLDLLQLRENEGLSLSPDGRYVAFVVGEAVYETNSYRSGLFVMSTDAGSTPVGLGTAGYPD